MYVKLCCIVIGIVCFSLAAAAIDNEADLGTVSLISDEWYPFNGEPGASKPGYMVEIAQAAFGKVDYRLQPWGRAVAEVRSGRVDCLIGADKEELPEMLFPSEHLGIGRAGVYVNQNDVWRYTGPESLKGRKIAVSKGYTFSAGVDYFMHEYAHLFSFNTGKNSIDQNLKQLLSGRVNTLIDNYMAVTAKAGQLKVAGKIKRVGFANQPVELFIACSPNSEKSERILKRLDETVSYLRESGELSSILSRYGLKDWVFEGLVY